MSVGIEAWSWMEEPELGDVVDLVKDGKDRVMTVRVLSRHDIDTYDIVPFPNDEFSDRIDMCVVPMGDLRPHANGPVAVFEDDGDGGEIVRHFRHADAAAAYARTVDMPAHVESFGQTYAESFVA